MSTSLTSSLHSLDGFKSVCHASSKIWVYQTNMLDGRLGCNKRMSRGSLQLNKGDKGNYCGTKSVNSPRFETSVQNKRGGLLSRELNDDGVPF